MILASLLPFIAIFLQNSQFFYQGAHPNPGMSHAFGGAPFTHYHGHFLVPVRPELSQLPSNQIRGQLMNFVHLGPVNFETLVFHTGSGELHKLGFYFNEHIMSIVVLNAMFSNSSGGDRAQFNQVNINTVFNIAIRFVVLGRLSERQFFTAHRCQV